MSEDRSLRGPQRSADHSVRSLVVVGNGMVGQRFLEAFRATPDATDWRVTVLCEEPQAAYDRVALSSYFEGRSAEELSLVPAGFFDEPGCTLHLAESATEIDRAARTVTTSNGRVLDYDALVLATGSRPFVPPVPGHELTGCFVYRTLDDLSAIEAYANGATSGAVVGGGLLGLEAANALRQLGLTTHVVEMAPRLMPLQVDEGGGQALSRHIEALGVRLHLGAATEQIEPDPAGRVARVRLTEREPIDVDLVVFSAGVRPRDELARAAGLVVGQRGGVVVDTGCQTSDPAIWAVGECANLDGAVYGLVAPGYAMAEVAADRIAGGSASFPGADTATKLKLLGVDVASFGDAFGTADGALELVFADQVAGVYKKLVVSDDARQLLGGVLVGDAAAYASLRPLVGEELPGPPEELLLGVRGAAPGELPPHAQVCTCNAVTKEQICTAITEHGLTDVAGVKECTRAGTGCGSCVPMVKTLLAESGVAVSRALCEHFDQTRAELFDIIRVAGVRTFSELVDRFGRGRGCDICKPAVASILASLGSGHILDGEQAALQDTNDHFLANLQRDGSYSVVPRVPGGEITPEKLIVIGEVARDFGLYTKITGGQRIDLFGARVEQLPQIWQRLVAAGMESGHAYGKALRTVKSCVGSTWCRYGVQDSTTLAIDLELRYRGLRAPHKIKMAVSGCARECAEARSKDVGVIATEHGWNLYVGGNGGFKPRHADLFLTDVDTETLVRTIDRFLMFYIRTADRLQRTAAWVEGLDGGLDYLRAVIMDDSLGIAGELDEAMTRHVGGYADEWQATLEDPQRLRRFVSFVNEPEVSDPSIVFVPERGQPRPPEGGAPPPPTLIAGPTLEVVNR
ncbi:nitrite reductase large subunit [Natronosporangium hydrolyticum]|uniref:assimilatory sulfite reductase (ferredoxin) n=1 Tax=Natronosporangium hydrolyticum TaxID=2811111 RepID=A0A895YEW4_9ACTN|nr:nitrite reductase large subunit NirB [Natronosporangium hydrolyticum]QSB16121.1 nitrite reductase large subunit [Natronosporangium hydrolyticum]